MPIKEQKKFLRKAYEHYLTYIVGTPELDKKSNGGRIPDNAQYGSWLRRNDPIAFNVGFNEMSRKYND